MISRLLNPFRNLLASSENISPGMYHYQSPADDPRNYRLHLRVENDGRGILIVNASTILHLNETATEYAYYFVNNRPLGDVIHQMTRRYRVEPEQAEADYLDFTDRVLTLVEIPDLDPITFLDFSRQTPYSSQISAPYRLDCALTYRLPDTADPAFAPRKNVSRELSTAEWQTVLEKAWRAGVPHIIFTGGEPTLRDDLPVLIAKAEQLGQVSGLLSDGRRLLEQGYLDALLQTGLDHLMILLDPAMESSWAAVQLPLPEDIFIAVHYTVTSADFNRDKAIINRLAESGVKAVSLSATDPALKSSLDQIADFAVSRNLALVWDIPVPYSMHNPVNLELPSSELVSGAGRAWLYIEPDGDVLPTQSADQVIGNILRDSWDKIWSAAGSR